jgi:hypothetical protein
MLVKVSDCFFPIDGVSNELFIRDCHAGLFDLIEAERTRPAGRRGSATSTRSTSPDPKVKNRGVLLKGSSGIGKVGVSMCN